MIPLNRVNEPNVRFHIRGRSSREQFFAYLMKRDQVRDSICHGDLPWEPVVDADLSPGTTVTFYCDPAAWERKNPVLLNRFFQAMDYAVGNTLFSGSKEAS